MKTEIEETIKVRSVVGSKGNTLATRPKKQNGTKGPKGPNGPGGISLKPSSAIPFTSDHCSNCGLPVVTIYVVYEKRWHKNEERWEVIRGRYEARHGEKQRIKVILDNGVEVEEEQTVLFNGDGSCPLPEKGKLWKYLNLGYEENSNEEKGREEKEKTAEIKEKEREIKETTISPSTGDGDSKINKDNEKKGKKMSTEEVGLNKGLSKTEIIRRKIAEARAKKEAAQPLAGGKQPVVEGKTAKLTGKPAKKKKEAKPKEPRVLNLCGDGCGEKVKNKFAMGHDARFHGWLKRLADGRMKPNDVPASVAKMLALKKKGEGYVPGITEEQYLEGLKGKGGKEE